MKNRLSLKAAILTTAIILSLFFGFYVNQKDNKSELSFFEISSGQGMAEETEISSSAESECESESQVQGVVVDVTGAVSFPGVYELDEGSRIIDAIDVAGGLTEEANLLYINRAEIIFDGMRIYIPTDEEVSNSNQPFIYNASNNQNTLIDINNAGPDELQKIPGVGPSMAEKIINYRNEHGRFSSIEDLLNISGIGQKTLEKMKGYITVK